jgi:hypothetical protein
MVVGGKMVLRMDESGTIQVAGGNITVDGAEIKLRGSQIKKVMPAGPRQQQLEIQRLEELRRAPAVADFRLVDQDGKPVANEPFRVEFADGTVRTGATDASGQAKVPAPKQGTYTVSFTRIEPSAWRKE